MFGTTTCAVLHVVVVFPSFQTYNVLIHPKRPLGQTAQATMLDDEDDGFFAQTAQGHVTAFQSGLFCASRVLSIAGFCAMRMPPEADLSNTTRAVPRRRHTSLAQCFPGNLPLDNPTN